MMEKVLSRLVVMLEALTSDSSVDVESLSAAFVESEPCAFPKTGNRIASNRILRTLQDTCLGIRKAEYRKVVHLSVLMWLFLFIAERLIIPDFFQQSLSDRNKYFIQLLFIH